MKRRNKRLSGGALILTIILALVFSVLCSAVILTGLYTSTIQSDSMIRQKLVRNMESATNIVLGSKASDTDISTDMDLFGEGSDSVSIVKGMWGVFNYAAINSFFRRFSCKRNFLYGAVLPSYMDACIYMADHQRALSLVGNTRLVGNAYLSGGGVRSSYIDQRGYSGSKLIDGQVKTHNGALPVLDEKVTGYLKGLLSEALAINEQNEFPPPMESYTQSFADTGLHFFSKGRILIDRMSLSGKIIVSSNEAIEITEAAVITDVILVAPVIRFKTGFRGNVQAIANDSLVVEQDCILEYPSALVLYKNKKGEAQGYMSVGKNSRVNGVMLTYSEDKDLPMAYSQIEEDALIKGIVYAMGYLSLKGNVHGCVLTDYFMYKSPSTTYENYLVDVEINRNNLSGYFIGSTIFPGFHGQKVIEWVR